MELRSEMATIDFTRARAAQLSPELRTVVKTTTLNPLTPSFLSRFGIRKLNRALYR